MCGLFRAELVMSELHQVMTTAYPITTRPVGSRSAADRSEPQEATAAARRFMDCSSSSSEIMGKCTCLRIAGLASFQV